jgi:hypothetical protein
MSRVITVVPKEIIIDQETGEIISDNVPLGVDDLDSITKDLAPGAHAASPITDQAPMGICPIHKKPFVEGKYGWYCKTKNADDTWCKEKPKPITPGTHEEVQKEIDELYGPKPAAKPQPVEPDAELVEGSNAWILAAFKSLGLKDVTIWDSLNKSYGVQTEKQDTVNMEKNLDQLTEDNRKKLTDVLKGKLEAKKAGK